MNESTRSLESWINRATAGLPPSAVEKFRAEIADHFAEARQKHAGVGMPPGEADRAALADLGDAQAVARTFRDAHFSRREYARGVAAALVSLVLLILWTLFRTLVLPGMALDIALSSALPYVTFAYQLSAGIACLLVARAALIFLAEQYDVRLPRLWQIAPFALIALTFGPSVLYHLIDYAAAASPALGRLIEPSTWVLMMQAAVDISLVSQVAAGALAVGVCVRQMVARPAGKRPALNLVLSLGALAGATLFAEMAVTTVLTLVPSPGLLALVNNGPLMFVNWGTFYLDYLFGLIVVVLLVVLLRLFARLSRAGEVILR